MSRTKLELEQQQEQRARKEFIYFCVKCCFLLQKDGRELEDKYKEMRENIRLVILTCFSGKGSAQLVLWKKNDSNTIRSLEAEVSYYIDNHTRKITRNTARHTVCRVFTILGEDGMPYISRCSPKHLTHSTLDIKFKEGIDLKSLIPGFQRMPYSKSIAEEIMPKIGTPAQRKAAILTFFQPKEGGQFLPPVLADIVYGYDGRTIAEEIQAYLELFIPKEGNFHLTLAMFRHINTLIHRDIDKQPSSSPGI